MSVLCALDFYDRVLLNLPTGAGKTYVGATIIREVLPARCLWIGDQDELCSQPREAIDKFAGIIPALEKAQSRAGLRARVVVGSAQTLGKQKRLDMWPSMHFDYIIIDEAHRGVEMKKRIMDHFPHAKVIGVTATPFRSDMRDLAKYYEHVAYAKPLIDLIGEGYAPPVKVETIPLEIDLEEVKMKRIGGEQDYDPRQLATTIAPYFEKVAELLKEHAAKRKVIVFLPLIESSKAFAAICRQAGITAIHVDGESEDRNLIIEGFKNGKYDLVSNAGLLGTGVDIPIADCFLNLCPTRSLSQYQQRFGRCARVLPGVIDGIEDAVERRARIAASAKKDVLVLDFLYQHAKLTRGAESLIAIDEDQAREMAEEIKKLRTPEELLAIQKAVQANREKKLVEEIERAAMKSKGDVEPREFAMLTGNRTLLDYEPEQPWERQPASEKQIALIKKHGVSTEPVPSMGLAKKLIGDILFRAQWRLAQPQQLRELRQLGVKHDPATLTRGEAMKQIVAAKTKAIK